MIKELFPESQPISELRKLIETELPKENLNEGNTLWATSVCSDEVNQSLNQLNDYFKAFGPFIMGGISGIPFAGKTGFKAFASHIPDNGGAVIIYGPHIGITKDGKVGMINRDGQGESSSCCGSLVAGLNSVKTGNVLNISHDDYQQGQVNKILIERYDEIKKADRDIVMATEVAYDQIKRELTDIVAGSLDSLGEKPLLLIGGIIINRDWDQDDLFEVRDVAWYNN
ncbi:hypothetical protein [Gracilimonas tropica]|uniref:hypothetical protein n=1 Tax=Gracilimonas tropica TaxID=454600 RepID=UPI000362FB0C|nr:hypothetical protein [Gracilimonas tropica]